MAIENKYIRADMVEVQEFVHLAHKYNVFGVPRTVINEDIHIEGAVPEKIFLLHVLKAADALTEDEKKELDKIYK
jgi:predicted DsbA family dithiol-disulfide isomerase